MIKNIFLLIAITWVNTSSAQAVIIQPENIAGAFPNRDGKAIQLVFNFDKPIQPSQFFEIYVGEKKAMDVINLTNIKIIKFITRLRLNKGEKISLRIDGSNGSTLSFIPEVTLDSVPVKEEYNPSIRASVVNESLAKTYGASVGDCVYLLTGISNSGPRVPKTIALKSNHGEVKITSSDKVSFSPFFLVGLSETSNQCSASIEEDTPNSNQPNSSSTNSTLSIPREVNSGKANTAVSEAQGSLIEAKAKCLDLGFKDKTEAFGKCVIRLSK